MFSNRLSVDIGKFFRVGKGNPSLNRIRGKVNLIECEENVTVYPFESLLQAPSGQPEYQGGPAWHHWNDQNVGRFYRRGSAIDIPPASEKASTNRYEVGFWCGPICSHFGHQIADFSTRIAWYADAVESGKIPPIPFVFARSSYDAKAALPSFFKEVCNWFSISPSSLVIVDEKPCHFKRLFFAPQGEQVGGPGPSKKYLRKLLRNQKRQESQLFGNEHFAAPKAPIFISRAAMRKGKIAGESAVEALLTKCDVHIVRPEILTLREQLYIYQKASSILAFEGSAIHALQLFGSVPTKIYIIPRIRGHRIAEQHLRPRVSYLSYPECVGHSIVPLNKVGASLTWEAISFLDLDKFLMFIYNELDINFVNDELALELLDVSEAMDLERWLGDIAKSDRVIPAAELDRLSEYLENTKRVRSLHVILSYRGSLMA